MDIKYGILDDSHFIEEKKIFYMFGYGNEYYK